VGVAVQHVHRELRQQHRVRHPRQARQPQQQQQRPDRREAECVVEALAQALPQRRSFERPLARRQAHGEQRD
jgi:hypothetical protein